MIKLKEAVIVEGKYDKIRLESLIDALIITTQGFEIFKDKEKMRLIRSLAEKRGLIIMTDSDSAGFMIRSHICSSVDPSLIKHVYIPDVLGKEHRKDAPGKEGKLGVEGMTSEVILQALERAGVVSGAERSEDITKLMLYEDGFIGSPDSTRMRGMLKRRLGLPERLQTNALVQVLNCMLTADEYRALVSELYRSSSLPDRNE